LWQLLAGANGEREAARVLAKLLGALEEHGEERVRPTLEAALTQQRVGLLDVIARTPDASSPMTVPARTPDASSPMTVPGKLADFVIEAGTAADYDHLLLAAGGIHE